MLNDTGKGSASDSEPAELGACSHAPQSVSYRTPDIPVTTPGVSKPSSEKASHAREGPIGTIKPNQVSESSCLRKQHPRKELSKLDDK